MFSDLARPSTQGPDTLKLCFIGNMNSMPLMYLRELRSRGHDVHMMVEAPAAEKLHRPEHRYPEFAAAYPPWMVDLPVRYPTLAYAAPRTLLAKLISRINEGRYDGLVLSGLNIGLAPYLKGEKFALLAGSDLDIYCDPRTADPQANRRRYGTVVGTLRSKFVARVVANQRRGLRLCGGFNYFPEGIHPRAEELLHEIYAGLSPARLQIRGTDSDQLVYTEPSRAIGDEVTILVPVRFLWKEPLPVGFSPPENKRNDIIIRGIAEFFRTTPFRPRIVLVAKGPDVEPAKQLAAELGIAHCLTWLSEMTPAEIIEWYRRADIVFDQLGSHMLGSVGLDSMLTGRPVIANARPEIVGKFVPEPSPVCQATTPQDVAGWLTRLVPNPELRRTIGLRSHEFVKKYYDKSQTAEWLEGYFRSRLRRGS